MPNYTQQKFLWERAGGGNRDPTSDWEHSRPPLRIATDNINGDDGASVS